MEQTKCPQCGQDIQIAKAHFCPHCGYILPVKQNTVTDPLENPSSKNLTLDEDQQNNQDQAVGEASNTYAQKHDPLTPISNPEQGASQTSDILANTVQNTNTENNASPTKKKGKLKWIILSIVFALLVLIFIIWIASSTAERNSYNEYIDNVNSAKMSMLNGAAQSEGIYNSVYKIWRAAIFDQNEEWDDDISAYKASDFNESIALYYADQSTINKIQNIKSNQSEVDSLMSKLKNPPSDLQTAYSTLNTMYEAYSSMTGLAISPTGNLQTYSSNFTTYDNNFMTQYKKLDNQIPDKK